jgi:hypothetical protein
MVILTWPTPILDILIGGNQSVIVDETRLENSE